jgi:hypothetical protein
MYSHIPYKLLQDRDYKNCFFFAKLSFYVRIKVSTIVQISYVVYSKLYYTLFIQNSIKDQWLEKRRGDRKKEGQRKAKRRTIRRNQKRER